MEDNLGPAFTEETGVEFAGEAHGSLGAAQLIRDGLRQPDVFVSADPVVNEDILMGSENGDLVRWYLTFASSELVLGYSPESPYAPEIESIAAGTPWYEVLAEPDLRFGRGDPTIDPKGYRTLFMFDLAAAQTGDASIRDLLGGDLNPDQVLPEVSLLARVGSGQFDAGIFYRHEAVAAGLPFVELPDEINLGNPDFADDYAKVRYQVPHGETVVGAPILFTITILEQAADPESAAEFVKFIANSPDQIADLGFTPLALDLQGDASALPTEIQSLVAQK